MPYISAHVGFVGSFANRAAAFLSSRASGATTSTAGDQPFSGLSDHVIPHARRRTRLDFPSADGISPMSLVENVRYSAKYFCFSGSQPEMFIASLKYACDGSAWVGLTRGAMYSQWTPSDD